MKWHKYKNDASILTPIQVTGANNSRMRDPMIAYDAAADSFHMVWTVSWTGTVIGYASSKNLKTWSPQVGLPLGANIANCSFTWAPEIIWDDIQSKWMIYWSCNNSSYSKIYCVSTNNFQSLTNPTTPQLLFNANYSVIDADIIKVAAGSYYMFFKDEVDDVTNSKCVKYATATKPLGPWTASTQKLTTYGTEGPCMVKQGGSYHLFFDPYGANKNYRMVKPTSLTSTASPWPNAGTLTDSTGTAFTYSHSNIIEIPRKYVMWMLYNRPLPTTSVKFEPLLRTSEVNTPYNGNINGMKAFDVSGRMISSSRFLNQNSNKFQWPVSGCYIMSSDKGKTYLKKTTVNK
jgi:hypothetical protein